MPSGATASLRAVVNALGVLAEVARLAERLDVADVAGAACNDGNDVIRVELDFRLCPPTTQAAVAVTCFENLPLRCGERTAIRRFLRAAPRSVSDTSAGIGLVPLALAFLDLLCVASAPFIRIGLLPRSGDFVRARFIGCGPCSVTLPGPLQVRCAPHRRILPGLVHAAVLATFGRAVAVDGAPCSKFLAAPSATIQESHGLYDSSNSARSNAARIEPEALLERIIKASSNEGDLVLDCFCGSGTTAAVAEKHNRRWVTCDLGRFAIHTARKRLLGVPQVKPFVVQNLGEYERQAWQSGELEAGGDALQVLVASKQKAYIEFILKLYHARPLGATPGCTASRTGASCTWELWTLPSRPATSPRSPSSSAAPREPLLQVLVASRRAPTAWMFWAGSSPSR